jgi:hypothetical protein
MFSKLQQLVYDILFVQQSVTSCCVCYVRWLLNLDGHIAAYRLANLLATNSLVLKQESNMVEYYYR